MGLIGGLVNDVGGVVTNLLDPTSTRKTTPPSPPTHTPAPPPPPPSTHQSAPPSTKPAANSSPVNTSAPSSPTETSQTSAAPTDTGPASTAPAGGADGSEGGTDAAGGTDASGASTTQAGTHPSPNPKVNVADPNPNSPLAGSQSTGASGSSVSQGTYTAAGGSDAATPSITSDGNVGATAPGTTGVSANDGTHTSGLSKGAAGAIGVFGALLFLVLLLVAYRRYMMHRRAARRQRFVDSSNLMTQGGPVRDSGWDFSCNSHRSSAVSTAESFGSPVTAQMQTIPAFGLVAARHVSLPPSPARQQTFAYMQPNASLAASSSESSHTYHDATGYVDLTRSEEGFSGDDFLGAAVEVPKSAFSESSADSLPKQPGLSPVQSMRSTARSEVSESDRRQTLELRRSSVIGYIPYISYPTPPSRAMSDVSVDPHTLARPNNPAHPPLSPLFASFDDPFASPLDGAVVETPRTPRSAHPLNPGFSANRI